MAGDSTTVTCTVVEGYPAANVTLTKDGVEVAEGTAPLSHQVTFVNADEGSNLVCTAINDVGSVTDSGAVDIMGEHF